MFVFDSKNYYPSAIIFTAFETTLRNYADIH